MQLEANVTAGSWGMDARGDVDANLANWLVLVLFVMSRAALGKTCNALGARAVLGAKKVKRLWIPRSTL